MICDSPDRIAARIYRRIWLALDGEARLDETLPDCPCCSFWRGFVIGGMVASVVAVAAFVFMK